MTNTWVVVDDRSLLEIEIWCTRVDSQGAWSGPAFHSEAPAIMLARGFALDDDSVFDKLRKMDCPTGFYVAGFNPGISLVDSRFVPWHAFTECRRPGDGALKEAAYVIPSGATNEDRHLIGWDGVGGQRSCASDEVGVGIWGAASQDRVEAFGMVCALWARVRPGSPVEKGAAQVPAPVDPVAEAKRTSVPAGKTYIIVNKLGQKIREFKAGEATTMTRECVPVECSRSVIRAARGSQVTCWRCGQD